MQEGAEAVGCRLSYFAMGAPDDERTPVAAVLYMPPHHILARHAHPAPRFEVLVQGTLDIGDRVLSPGDIMVTDANEMYGPHTAGPDGRDAQCEGRRGARDLRDRGGPALESRKNKQRFQHHRYWVF